MNEKEVIFPEKLKDPDDKMEEEFKDFIDENGFTASQMEKAYYNFCGISEEGEQDEAIDKIVAKMNEMADNKFPINRFAELVEAKEDYDNSEAKYFEYVNNLNISEKEKRVLQSIVKEKRSGELGVVINGKTVAELQIDAKDAEAKAMAVALERAINRIIKEIAGDKKYGFTFMEE